MGKRKYALMKCPYCGLYVAPTSFSRHFAKYHSEKRKEEVNKID